MKPAEVREALVSDAEQLEALAAVHARCAAQLRRAAAALRRDAGPAGGIPVTAIPEAAS